MPKMQARKLGHVWRPDLRGLWRWWVLLWASALALSLGVSGAALAAPEAASSTQVQQRDAAPLAQPEKDHVVAPVFSHDSGFYASPFELALSHPDADVQIYYTLDGSDPDPANLDGTTYRYKNVYAETPQQQGGDFLTHQIRTYRYTQPIPVRDRRHEPDRYTHISTTFGGEPNYFPPPPLGGDWLNTGIWHYNRYARKLNDELNNIEFRIRRVVQGKDKYRHLYSNYLPLMDYRPSDVYQYKGVVVRAQAIAADGRRSPVLTHTYFVGAPDQFAVPVVSLVLPEPDLFGYDDGLFVPGRPHDEWLESGNFDLRVDTYRPANWRVPRLQKQAHLTIFDTNGRLAGSTDVDIRVHGNFSRVLPQKSIRIYPRKKYNPDGLPYDLFDSGQDVGHNRIILRNGGNEYAETRIKDAAIQRIMAGLNFGTQRAQPVVLFLNGEYYGLLTARDRQDQHYLASMYHLPTRKVDILERHFEPDRGDADHWQPVLDLVETADKGSDAFYHDVSRLIDLDNFIDYHIAQIYIANTDWPANNVALWRYAGGDGEDDNERGKGDGVETAEAQEFHGTESADGHEPHGTERAEAQELHGADGRWRWLMFDTDQSMRPGLRRGPRYNTLEVATDTTSRPNRRWATNVLSSLLQNPQFRERFVTRFIDLLNTAFLPERFEAIIRDAQREIAPEIPRHINRWTVPASVGEWNAKIDGMVQFAYKRPAHQRKHIEKFFDLKGRYDLTVEISDEAAGSVRVNTITLGQHGTFGQNPANRLPPVRANAQFDAQVLAMPWRGQYFKGLPLQLEAVAAPGWRFSHWEGAGLTGEQVENSKLELRPGADVSVRAVMVAK